MPVRQGTKEYEQTMEEYRRETERAIEEYRRRIRKIRQADKLARIGL